MTESQWLWSSDPLLMLASLGDGASKRKLRLFACACCQRIGAKLADSRSRAAIEVAEGIASDDELAAASALAEQAFHTFAWEADGNAGPRKLAASAVWGATATDLTESVFAGHPMTGFAQNTALQAADATESPDVEREAQADLLRDIFGNPFRPAVLDPDWLAWNGGTVGKLARAIYGDRRWENMPILADALEDAMCHDAAILDHCRGPGPHARGCWVVDLLTGKE